MSTVHDGRTTSDRSTGVLESGGEAPRPRFPLPTAPPDRPVEPAPPLLPRIGSAVTGGTPAAASRIADPTRRATARSISAWRSSLQVRIGAITMAVAGTVVIIVSIVLFSQIRDQLLKVKERAA